MLKPDGVRRGLTGTILERIERRGFEIVAMKKTVMSRTAAEEHYGEHRERPFFGELVAFITSGPVVMLAVDGPNAIAVLREMMGKTNPAESAPGTIRGDFALEIGENVIHGSDGVESAARELQIHFGAADFVA